MATKTTSLLLFCFLISLSVFAQERNLDKQISFQADNITIVHLLKQLRSQRIPLTWTESGILNDTISVSVRNGKVSDLLDNAFRYTALRYKEIGNQIVIYEEKQKFTISGFVSNIASGEKLIHANIYNEFNGIGTVSNNYGFYSLTFPAGRVDLVCSYIGFSEYVSTLHLQSDTVINISLLRSYEIDEVLIKDRINNKIERVTPARFELLNTQITSTPALLGESDLQKTLQLYPGISSNGDASNGLFIRGGSPDQNLILLDGVTVYNANHLFGMFSIFNTDAIQSANVYTGGFPAQYGGRLSSVIDVRLKEGNEKKFESEIDMGLISSKFEIEAPLQKGQTTFVISGRRTYIDLFSAAITDRIEKLQRIDNLSLGYSFYDLYSKLSHTFSQKSRMYLSFYTGNDDILYDARWEKQQSIHNRDYFKLGWGNIISSLRWNYMFTNKLFSNTTFSYSKYKFDSQNKYDKSNELRNSFSKYSFDYTSGIDDLSMHVEFDYLPSPDHFIRFGLANTFHLFNPGISISGEGKSLRDNILINQTMGNERIFANEFALFVGDDYKYSKQLKINIGLRYAGFISDNKLYQSLEPRFSYRYRLSKNIALKAAVETMTQFVHLLSNNAVEMPTDLWLPSTQNIRPQKSIQSTVGIFALPNRNYEFSAEMYYKKLLHLIDYKEDINFEQSTSDWAELTETGSGNAYGFELLIRKPEGKINGHLSYSWAHSNRTFANLNNGEEFASTFDRRHQLNFISQYNIGKQLAINLQFTMGSGYPATLPSARYQSAEIGSETNEMLFYYQNKNNFRLPYYHRLDIMAKFRKPTKYGENIFRFGIYNVYNRMNPFFVYLETDPNKNTIKNIKQISIFPVLPILSFAVKFK